jgi:RHS repeat-associated protein
MKSVSGITINPYIWQGGMFTNPQGSVVDPNGNTISSSYNSSNTTTTFIDTLNVPSKPVLTVDAPVPGATPATLSYWNPQGNNNTPYTIKYTQQTIETNFGCSLVLDVGRSNLVQQYLVSEIDLPDNSTKYLFGYEPTPNPNHSGAVTGRLASVTLPTGGTISYTYAGGNAGITCADGTTATLERYTPDTGSSYWNYAHLESGAAWTTTVTDPESNVGTYYFEQVAGTQYAYEQERQTNQGASSVLATVNTCYNGAPIPCTGTAINYPLSNRTVQTTLPSTSPSKTYTTYNTYNLPTEVDEYDWGGSTASRKTLTTYANGNSCGVTNTYVVNRPCSVTVYGSGSSPAAQATYAYDANGNLLTETHTNTGGSPSSISRTFTYNTNGTLKTSTDFNSSSNKTTYSYGTYSCNGSFPDGITPPIGSLAVSYQYDCNGGVVTQVTDPNSQPTKFKYTDPNNFWRLVETDYPDGGVAQIAYTDTTGDFTVANSVQVTSGNPHTVTQTLDGLGRVIKSVDSQTSAEVDTGYNSVGLVASVSNPHTGTPAPSDGLTQYSYDALGRPADVGTAHAIKFPDGGYTSVTYPGNCATVVDPANKGRKLCSDGLGRLSSVTGDPTGMNFKTTYTYDALNDLTGANPTGQTRTYNYDMLGRLTSVQVPEVNVRGSQCTTSYGHDANGNVISRKAPRENQNASCTTYVTTTYGYDTLNRLTSKTYSDTTPPANFFYDQAPTSWPSWTNVTNVGFLNPKGRLLLACTGSAPGTCASPTTAAAYSYDPVGRPLDFWQCNPSNCAQSTIWNTNYTYDLAGDVANWGHPGGFNLTNSVNQAQQTWQVQSSLQDSTHPQYLANNITYNPWGAVSTLENGCVGSGCTNALETYTYNNRLQPSMIELGNTSNATANSCWVYNYYKDQGNPSSCATPSQGTENNGDVMGYWYNDNVWSFSHTASYTYEALNRLATAAATPFGSGNISYNLTFSTDHYGNMTCTTNAQTNGPCGNYTFNTGTNQISTSGFAYDAAGNLTTDASVGPTPYTYLWDAEGRMTSVTQGSTSIWNFTYNALGQRVQWAYPSGADQHLFDPAGNWLGIAGVESVIPFGTHLFTVYWNGDTFFYHKNNLGSTNGVTNHAGTETDDALFYPWGQAWEHTENFADLPYYDYKTHNIFAQFRTDSPGLGRWLSPDPVGGDITNPQSLNRYAYVLNNPTSMIDPLGLSDCGGNPDVDCNDPSHPPDPPNHGGGGVGLGTDPSSDCSYTDSNDASCSNPAGLWSNGAPIYGGTGGGLNIGIWGDSGFGSGPLSGDFGPMGYPSSGIGLPCDFGTCAGPWPNGFREVQTGIFQPVTYWIPEWSDIAFAYQILVMGKIPQLPGQPRRLELALGVIAETVLWDLCGHSPNGAVENWTITGMTKGAAIGALQGGATGTVLGTPVGGFFGAILGGLTEGTIAGTGGAFMGTAAAQVCSALGAYGH